MGTSYYAIDKETVITAGIEALLRSTPESLLRKAMQKLEQGALYSLDSRIEEDSDIYFEIGEISVAGEGRREFHSVIPQEKLLEALKGSYLIVDEYARKYTPEQFVDILKQSNYSPEFLRAAGEGKR